MIRNKFMFVQEALLFRKIADVIVKRAHRVSEKYKFVNYRPVHSSGVVVFKMQLFLHKTANQPVEKMSAIARRSRSLKITDFCTDRKSCATS